MKATLTSGHYFIFGIHAVQAALNNPQRVKRKLYATGNASEKLKVPEAIYTHTVDGDWLDKLLPDFSVHQGVALEVQALPQPHLMELAETGKRLLMLDQVSDPHNIGAILRSAAAFDVGGIIVQDKHAPRENATIAKTAAGALELIPLVAVTNLTRALKELQNAGYWSVGMDGDAKQTIDQLNLDPKTVLVMGAEGSGLRRLVAEKCDLLAKLSIHSQMESLNVSVATGISLYALAQKIG
ncbi:MAG: 23S rRNA (guanosine(2251)-2'-O)-methyltransferase RlmB [Rickettsiales bacterium]|nr:23S rRNA (guanosine(2251)-2'-O)-methyltransferase RlmB [Rickettsiales bacterium]